MSIMISDSCVDVMEERNSGGGKTVVYSEQACIAKARRLSNFCALNWSAGGPENGNEQRNTI